MIEVLNHIDDLKKIRQLLLGGKVKDAVKECDVVIAYKQQEVEEFEKWAEKESKKETEFAEKIDELNQETDTLLEEIDKWQM